MYYVHVRRTRALVIYLSRATLALLHEHMTAVPCTSYIMPCRVETRARTPACTVVRTYGYCRLVVD